MRRAFILLLFSASLSFAQTGENAIYVQRSGAVLSAKTASPAPVLGAPYSATATSEVVQTLADGNRIVVTATGTFARDSEGRTRQDAPVPSLGLPANTPRLVFIQDPVAQTSYTLNLTDKTAQKMPTNATALPVRAANAPGPVATASPIAPGPANTFFLQVSGRVSDDGAGAPPLPPLLPSPGMQVMIATGPAGETGATTTEDLGSKTIDDVFVTGTRTTRTIPAGAIGNEQPIRIVSEVWTSPDLKTIVYSKRSDPRIGDQTFQLTNISRAEPDPTLFAVPSDFTVSNGPQPTVFFRAKE